VGEGVGVINHRTQCMNSGLQQAKATVGTNPQVSCITATPEPVQEEREPRSGNSQITVASSVGIRSAHKHHKGHPARQPGCGEGMGRWREVHTQARRQPPPCRNPHRRHAVGKAGDSNTQSATRHLGWGRLQCWGTPATGWGKAGVQATKVSLPTRHMEPTTWHKPVHRQPVPTWTQGNGWGCHVEPAPCQGTEESKNRYNEARPAGNKNPGWGWGHKGPYTES